MSSVPSNDQTPGDSYQYRSPTEHDYDTAGDQLEVRFNGKKKYPETLQPSALRPIEVPVIYDIASATGERLIIQKTPSVSEQLDALYNVDIWCGLNIYRTQPDVTCSDYQPNSFKIERENVWGSKDVEILKGTVLISEDEATYLWLVPPSTSASNANNWLEQLVEPVTGSYYMSFEIIPPKDPCQYWNITSGTCCTITGESTAATRGTEQTKRFTITDQPSGFELKGMTLYQGSLYKGLEHVHESGHPEIYALTRFDHEPLILKRNHTAEEQSNETNQLLSQAADDEYMF